MLLGFAKVTHPIPRGGSSKKGAECHLLRISKDETFEPKKCSSMANRVSNRLVLSYSHGLEALSKHLEVITGLVLIRD